MEINFEPTRSFCYKFARYTVLAEIQSMPLVISGDSFRLTELSQQIIDKYITKEQQQIKIRRKQTDKTEPVHSIIKFFVQFHVKDGKIFIRLGNGFYKNFAEEEISDDELDEIAVDEGDEDTAEYEGWIYAFSFPQLLKVNEPFPIKIGMTLTDVENRVFQQCKGSAIFENPILLGKWETNKVGQMEVVIHSILKVRGKWRENVPGNEWFNTTVTEIEAILAFLSITEKN